MYNHESVYNLLNIFIPAIVPKIVIGANNIMLPAIFIRFALSVKAYNNGSKLKFVLIVGSYMLGNSIGKIVKEQSSTKYNANKRYGRYTFIEKFFLFTIRYIKKCATNTHII